jgi:hypothetical protein
MAALVSEPPAPRASTPRGLPRCDDHAATISDAELARLREHGYCFLGHAGRRDDGALYAGLRLAWRYE